MPALPDSSVKRLLPWMVPVGRLTIVRTFERSELVRAMSFVTIPALIGPTLGPVAGGLIVGYFHWRVIFFVNLPIGILVLGAMTVLSAVVFRELKPGDGDSVSRHGEGTGGK